MPARQFPTGGFLLRQFARPGRLSCTAIPPPPHTRLQTDGTGNRKQETGNRKQETGNRKQETGNRKQETAALACGRSEAL